MLENLRIHNPIDFLRRYKNVFIFLSGFLIDVFTIKRIDALTDLALQIFYLLCLSFLLVYQHRSHRGLWTPPRWFQRIWNYNVEILHFLYGGLLSAYVILYFKSTSGLRALLFLALLAILTFLNEMPQVRRVGYRLRLGLYAFCVTSFLIYFVPILVGRMGLAIFIFSLLLSTAVVWMVAVFLAAKSQNEKRERLRLFAPAGVLLLIILLLYHWRLIPPVPLSIQYQGIFHRIKKSNDTYILEYPKPPFWAFWRDDSRPFQARAQDRIFYFARIFAPVRFKHQIFIRWDYLDPVKQQYKNLDRIPLDITGGREKGFRGFTSKKNLTPGRWRISSETSDGRILGKILVRIEPDGSQKPRKWKQLKM